MTPILSLDWETHSKLDLRKVGLHRYATDASTDIWCGAYAFGDEEPSVWIPGEPCPPRIVEHVESGGAVYAWNAPFEIALWNNVAVPRYGWPVLKPESIFCSMAMSYSMGMPGNLEDAALALGLSILKDTEGRNLMLKMADKNRYPVAKQEDVSRLAAYSKQDVRVENAARQRLLPLSDKERKVWLLDYKINQRGVQIDLPSARAAVKLAETVKGQANEKLSKITKGAVQAVTAVAALKGWIATQGTDAASLAKQSVVDLLSQDVLPANVREALVVRQEAAKASTAKFEVMVRQAGDDDRLRNMYQYHGAATGRWAGRGVQVHNLPRDMPESGTVEKILEFVRAGDYDAIDMIYGAPLSAASRCLRSFFVAPAGKRLISGDWSNVESRGGAWFAGEEWKLKAFREQDAGTGPEVYKLGASRLLGISVDSVTPEQRQSHGKVPDLAFQYQGGVGSGKTMGKTLGVKATDAEWEMRKVAWRSQHPRIVGTWKEIQNAAINAVRSPGEKYGCGYPGRQAFFRTVGSFLWCLLPSGRAICFPYPKLLDGEYGVQLTYMSKPGPDKADVIADPKNVSNWARVGTYGGSLLNNINQGLCRDFLADGLLALDAKGAAIVLHTHDSISIETDVVKAEGARKAMETILCTPPAWAAGFPLVAGCDVESRFRG